MLVTYSKLLNALLAPPRTTSTSDVPPDWQKYVEWITVLSQNIMAAANDLRPVQVCYACNGLLYPWIDTPYIIQARMNLESLMKKQLELRKEETKALHSYELSPSSIFLTDALFSENVTN
jgi:mediator of RNA polymerase II transcription subunit 7